MIEKILNFIKEERIKAQEYRSEKIKESDYVKANVAHGEIQTLNKVEAFVQEVAKDGGWIPCSSGQKPTECEEVNVTIEDDEGDVYTTTSWAQEGVWVVKKTALHPRVIAWKPKDAPYQKGE